MTPVKEKKGKPAERKQESMTLGNLRKPHGATHREKRLGMGESSGHGKTSGKGHKGQNSRSGGGTRPGFEGGSMPLIRRIPKRGFTHVRKIETEIVNLESLSRFPANATVDPAALIEKGLIHKGDSKVKILGDGSLTHALTVKAHRFSKSAAEKIAAAGGKAEQIA